MEQQTEIAILYDRNEKGLSYRTLARKYGISCTQIHRMVMSKQKKQEKPKEIKRVIEEVSVLLPDDIKALKEELRLARLKIEMQDLIIDISSKELGIDLRKKRGTRLSK
jgi:cyanate lyase